MGTAGSIAKNSDTNGEDEGHNIEIVDEVRDYNHKSRADDGTSQIRRTFSGLRSFSLKKSQSSKTSGGVKKSFSLMSARSFEIEGSSDTVTIKQEYENFRNRTNAKIAGLEMKEDRLNNENQRLRGELKVRQSHCDKLLKEREGAIKAEEQALQRAASLETERDKLRKHFKVFRESKEQEVQDILHAKRELEKKMNIYFNCSDEYYANNEDGLPLPDDWLTSSYESEQSVDELSKSNTPLRGLETMGVLMEKHGPFTNINRDDWRAVIPSVMQIISTGLQTQLQPSTIQIYLSAPSSMEKEVEIMTTIYFPHLQLMCEKHGKFLSCIHFRDSETSGENFRREHQMRMEKIKQCRAFVAFLGKKANRRWHCVYFCFATVATKIEENERFTSDEFKCSHLDCPEKLFSVFCFKNNEYDSTDVGDEDSNLTEDLKTEIRKTSTTKLFDNYESADIGAELSFRELKAFLKQELNLDGSTDDKDRKFDDLEEFELDMLDDCEQVEILRAAASSPWEVGLGKHHSKLNEYTMSEVPEPPLLLLSEPGAGKTVLLAKWIAMQSSMSGGIILYHFVTSPSSSSANPALMLRRFTAQLMRQQAVSPCLAGDQGLLKQEFVRWLEKVSSKVEGGVTVVIDSADRLQGGPGYMKWLLDPLPVGARVVLSASEETCPAFWKSWQVVRINGLAEKECKEVLQTYWNNSDIPLTPEQVCRVMYGYTQDEPITSRFLSLLASETSCCKDSQALLERSSVCWSKKDVVSLLCHIIDEIEAKHFGSSSGDLLKDLLLCIFVSRNGLNESELLQLVPVDWLLWIPLSKELFQRNILTSYVGLMRFDSEQVREAVMMKYLFDEEDEDELLEARQKIIDYYSEKQRIRHITYRLVDELPWQLKRIGRWNTLRKCLENFTVFTMFLERGRASELVEYWHELNVDQKGIGNVYLRAVKAAEIADEVNPAEIADMYEKVGRFVKSLNLCNQALQPLQKALEIREVVTDPDGPLVAQSLHHLAECNAQCGKLSIASTFYKQALEIKENALGKDHPNLAKELEGLAMVYRRNDKPSLADPFHKRAVSIRKKTMGCTDLRRKTIRVEDLSLCSCNPEVANSLNELGVVYYLQNNLESAKSFLQRSLEMREAVLGPNHPDVAQSLHNLASLYNDQKQYEKAQPLYERALKIRVKALPANHASVASTVKHLAVLYKKQAMYSEAEPLYRQALDVQEKTFGPNHPSVATALHNLAVVLCLQEKQSVALPFYKRALRIYEESLGMNHSRVAETLRNLSKLYLDMGDKKTAAKLYRRVMEIPDSDAASSLAGVSRRISESDVSSYSGNLEAKRHFKLTRVSETSA